MRTAVYLRKSRAEEINDTVDDTLRRHKETLLDFARRENLTVLAVYEEVVSGENLYTRLEMLRLLNDVEALKYDAVLCMDIDRLGRGAMSQQGIILETFKTAGTRIITPRKTYDLSNELDEEYTEFQTFFARRELKTIKRRMRQGVTKTVQEGGYIANAPYGYEKCRVGKLPSLRIVEEEACHIRTLFDLYVNRGGGCQAAADLLNSMGAHPRRGAAFSRSTVLSILRNPVYTGKIVWNRSRFQRPDGKNPKHLRSSNPEERWIVTDGLHEPIISDELFRRAQEVTAARRHPPHKARELVNPLAGLLVCARCGAKLQLRRDSGEHGSCLLCPTRGCMPAIPFLGVEAAVLECVRPLFESLPVGLPEEDERQKQQAASASLERELSRIKGQQERLYALLEQEVYSPDLFFERKQALEEQEQRLREARAAILPELEELGCPMATVWDAYQAGTAAERNGLLKVAVSEVVCYKEKGWQRGQFLMQVRLLCGGTR